MRARFHGLKRGFYAVVALALTAAVAFPRLIQEASASQVSSRSIEMSSSAQGATGTTYTVNFTFGSSYSVQGIIVDFCDNDPIIGDSCTAPTGFDVGGTTPTVTTSGTIGTSGWTAAGKNVITGSQYRTLDLTDASGVAVTNSSTATINLTNVTNPTTANHTFYARIVTYTTTAAANSYAAGTEGTFSDYGGVALSTSNVISITAKVQEYLQYCVAAGTGTNGSTNPISSGCGGGPFTTAITLGHGSGSVLDSSQVDTYSAWTQASTNANSGIKVRMKSNSVSGGLNSGSNSIPPLGATPAAIPANTADFGMFAANGTGGTGTVTADPSYNDNTSTHYGMDVTTTNDNVLSTYGSQIASSASVLSNVNEQFTFAAQASPTTPAGLYTTSMTFIATGTF